MRVKVKPAEIHFFHVRHSMPFSASKIVSLACLLWAAHAQDACARAPSPLSNTQLWQNFVEQRQPLVGPSGIVGNYLDHAYVSQGNGYTLPVHDTAPRDNATWAQWAAAHGPHLHFEVHNHNNEFVVCSTTSQFDDAVLPPLLGYADSAGSDRRNAGCMRGIQAERARWSGVLAQLAAFVESQCGGAVFVLHVDTAHLTDDEAQLLFARTTTFLDKALYLPLPASVGNSNAYTPFPSVAEMSETDKNYLLVGNSSHPSVWPWPRVPPGGGAQPAEKYRYATRRASSFAGGNQTCGAWAAQFTEVTEDTHTFPVGTPSLLYNGSRVHGVLSEAAARVARDCGFIVRNRVSTAERSAVAQWLFAQTTDGPAPAFACDPAAVGQSGAVVAMLVLPDTWRLISDYTTPTLQMLCKKYTDRAAGEWMWTWQTRVYNDTAAECYPSSHSDYAKARDFVASNRRTFATFSFPVARIGLSAACSPHSEQPEYAVYRAPIGLAVRECPSVNFDRVRRADALSVAPEEETVAACFAAALGAGHTRSIGEDFVSSIGKLATYSTSTIIIIATVVVVVSVIIFVLITVWLRKRYIRNQSKTLNPRSSGMASRWTEVQNEQTKSDEDIELTAA